MLIIPATWGAATLSNLKRSHRVLSLNERRKKKKNPKNKVKGKEDKKKNVFLNNRTYQKIWCSSFFPYDSPLQLTKNIFTGVYF